MTTKFSFNTEFESDLFRSFAGMVKNNNGFFKSAKHRWFIFNKTCGVCMWHDGKPIDAQAVAFLKSNFGVEAEVGQHIFTTSGTAQWAHGMKACRRVEWMWVLDEFGVVRKYKLAFSYSTSGGSSSVNAKRTKLDFQRDVTVALPVLVEAPKPVELPSHFVGKRGARGTFSGVTIVKVMDLGYHSYGYHVGGTLYLTIMRDALGNVIKTFGNLNAKVGDVVNFSAFVKDHSVYNDREETIVNRVKLI